MNAPLDPQYIEAIRGFEGYSPKAAWDYKQSSSGYGTKAQPGDENLSPEQLKAVHEQRFQGEIQAAAAHVDSINPNLPPGARAALIDLTYNAGPGWAKAGLGDLVRAGDLQGAQARLLEYNKAGGEALPGLAKRRQTAASWFGGEQPQPVSASPAGPANAPSGAPLNIASQRPFSLPPQAPNAPPVLPSAAPAAPHQGGGYFAQMQAEQMPPMSPIFAQQRRPPDISKLRAALQARSMPGFFFGRG